MGFQLELTGFHLVWHSILLSANYACLERERELYQKSNIPGNLLTDLVTEGEKTQAFSEAF